MKVTLTRNMRIGGRLYRTGDAAPIARQHARVLIATGRAKTFVEKPQAATPPPTATPPVMQEQPVHVEHAAAEPERIHHEFHQTAPAPKAAAEAVKTQPKAAAAKKASTGQKVEK